MTRHNEAGERYRFMPPFSIKAILLYLLYSPCHTLKNPMLLSIFSALSETRPSSDSQCCFTSGCPKKCFWQGKASLAGKQVFYLWAIFPGM
jgi:hypothetical protein